MRPSSSSSSTDSPVRPTAASPTAPATNFSFDLLSQPIINAPMAGAAGGALAAAVSQAGGLGLVGVGHGAGSAFIDRELPLVQDAVEHPTWGAGLMSWSLDLDDAALRHCLSYSPPVIALAAGDPSTHARLAHGAGCFVLVQVGTSAEIDAAHRDPNIDAIVVRGAEAGGHGLNTVSTLPLLQYALTATDKPVVAAGGIATLSGLASVLAAGAQAAWIGTRFIPTAESLASKAHREAVLGASLESSVYTSVFDIALGLPWPHDYGGRALRNDVTESWAGPRENSLRTGLQSQNPDALALAQRVHDAKAAGDPSASPMYAGQAAGLTRPDDASPRGASDGERLPSAADVVQELAGFRTLLATAARRWS